MLSAAQIRGARAILRLTTVELASLAKVAPNTIVRLEAGKGANASTLDAVQRALESMGLIFIPEDEAGGAGVRLRDHGAPLFSRTSPLRLTNTVHHRPADGLYFEATYRGARIEIGLSWKTIEALDERFPRPPNSDFFNANHTRIVEAAEAALAAGRAIAMDVLVLEPDDFHA